MNSKYNRISVITTFYNAKDFLLNAIDSVWQQLEFLDKKYEIEYVIVDDKSPDDSRRILESYMSNHNHKQLIWKLVEPTENLGCGGARKFGIDHASGEFFMFLDADDYYMNKNFISRAINDIITNGADIVEYGVMYNNPDGSRVNSSAPQKMTFTNFHDVELALFRDNLIKFNVWTKIYRRKVVESYPYSTVRTFEDVRTIPIWCSNASKIVIMPTCEVNYRAAQNSIIRTNWVETRLGTISAIAELFPLFKNDLEVLKAMYTRSMIDIDALMNNHSSENEGFTEMSRLNTLMLSYIYPKDWETKVYHTDGYVEELKESKKIDPNKYLKTDINTLPGN